MKKRLKIALLITLIFAFTAACTTFAGAHAAGRWFNRTEKTDNSAKVVSWIKVTVTPEEGFGANDVYAADFTVRQWAEGGNYKLVLSGVKLLDKSGSAKSPDAMWEYYSGGGVWKPISNAINMELIPDITLSTHTAELKIRVVPGFFEAVGFAPYLDSVLELTAELLLQ